MARRWTRETEGRRRAGIVGIHGTVETDPRQVSLDPLRPLGQYLVRVARRSLDDLPRLIAPRISGLVEEIRHGACENHPPLPPSEWIIEGRLGPLDDREITTPSRHDSFSVAILAPRTHLVASRPRVPSRSRFPGIRISCPFNRGSLAHVHPKTWTPGDIATIQSPVSQSCSTTNETYCPTKVAATRQFRSLSEIL